MPPLLIWKQVRALRGALLRDETVMGRTSMGRLPLLAENRSESKNSEGRTDWWDRLGDLVGLLVFDTFPFPAPKYHGEAWFAY